MERWRDGVDTLFINVTLRNDVDGQERNRPMPCKKRGEACEIGSCELCWSFNGSVGTTKSKSGIKKTDAFYPRGRLYLRRPSKCPLQCPGICQTLWAAMTEEDERKMQRKNRSLP